MKRAIAVFLSVWSLSVLAQTATDVTPAAGGLYVLKIDGRPYVALAKAQLDEMTKALQENAALKERLARAEHDLKEYRSLTDAYEKLRKDYVALTDKYKALADDSLKLGERYSESAGKLVDLNKDYRGLVTDYDALAQKYRDVAVRSAPRHPLDLGVGIVRTGDTDRVVALAGIGTEIFRVGLRAWVFGGEGAYGVMVGASF